MNIERLKTYASLTVRKRDVSKELDELKSQLSILESELLDELTSSGLTQARVETESGMFTLFPKRQIWASLEEGVRLEAIEAFEAHGMKDLLSPNYQALSAWCREREDHGEEPVPDFLVGLVKVTEKYTLNVTKAG